METNLVATVRKDTGSAESRRLRSSGSIPAVVYGLDMEPKSVYIDAREFNNALKTDAGANVILNLSIGKKDTVTALPREIQRHPYKDQIVHVDLIQIDLTQTVEADVSLEFTGIPIGVKDEGGVIQTINNTITIVALPASIPSSLEIDISELNVGDNVVATEVDLPEGVSLATEGDDSILVTVNIPRAVVEEEEVLEAGLEGEEGLEGEAGLEGEEGQETGEEADQGESSEESGE